MKNVTSDSRQCNDQSHKHQNQSGVVWNSLGSAAFAASSMLMLAVVSRVLGVPAAGDFGIGYATAQILYNIGLYGVNSFQMTDYSEEYNYKDYFNVKIITTSLMMVVGIGYIIIFDVEKHREYETILMITYMAIHSFAELYQSQLFQRNRLDLAGKSLFCRTISSLAAFSIVLFFTKNLMYALIMANLVNAGLTLIIDRCVSKVYQTEPRAPYRSQMGSLLKRCTPLFISLFMMTYIINSSKYSIDIYMSRHEKGIYNILYIFIISINLLGGFIFKPFLNRFSRTWNENQPGSFRRFIWKMLLAIGLTVILMLVLVQLAGVWLVWFVFHADIGLYNFELWLTVIGGGLLAISAFTYYMLVIMRKLKTILLGFTIGALIAWLTSLVLVRTAGIEGGILSLITTFLVIDLIFCITILRGTKEGACPE